MMVRRDDANATGITGQGQCHETPEPLLRGADRGMDFLRLD